MFLLPPRDDLTFNNGFYANCSALFVDIRDSSKLPDKHKRPVLARLYRSFVSEMVAVFAGFAKVRVDPGGSERVTVRIPRRTVSYYDVDAHGWAPAAGTAEIRVGASSRDIRVSAPLAL